MRSRPRLGANPHTAGSVVCTASGEGQRAGGERGRLQVDWEVASLSEISRDVALLSGFLRWPLR